MCPGARVERAGHSVLARSKAGCARLLAGFFGLLMARLLVGWNRLGRLAVARDLGDVAFLLTLGADLALDDASTLEQPLDRLGRLRADAEPVAGALDIHVQRERLRLRIVEADRLDKAPVTRRARVGDDDAVMRLMLGAHASESDLQHSSGVPSPVVTSFICNFWSNAHTKMPQAMLRTPHAITFGLSASILARPDGDVSAHHQLSPRAAFSLLTPVAPRARDSLNGRARLTGCR